MTDLTRRKALVSTGIAIGSMTALAGCIGDSSSGGSDDISPQGDALQSEAVSWDDLGDLEGELTVYSGRKRTQINPLFEKLEDEYPDLTISADFDGDLNQLTIEGESTPADVFYTQSSGELANLKAEGLTLELPTDIQDAISDNHSDPDGQWVGASGRVRATLYNSNYFSGDELPDDIFAYADDNRFEDVISTRPNSGSFRSFIVAMMELEDEARTREWVDKMVNKQNADLYASGSTQAEAVHNGEQQIALGNQYYAGRIISNNPDSPLEVAFTNNDPGCLFNVSGVAITASTDNAGLAAEFTRHVLAKEGQEFFVDVNGEYPVVDDVEYVGDLPTPDEINPPEFDLNALADVDEAAQLLRDEGMTV